MSTKDPAEEFAERVEEKFWEQYDSFDHSHPSLSLLIAFELRAGGWQQFDNDSEWVKGRFRVREDWPSIP